MTFGFTNIQIYLANRPSSEARTAVVAAIHQILLDRTFEPVSDATLADRMIVVGPAETRPWISLFDESIGGDASLEELLRMLRELSIHLHTNVVGFKLIDHLFHMLFAQEGRLINHVVIKPRYRATTKPKVIEYLHEHAQQWQSILPIGVEPEHLEAVWQHTKLDRIEGIIELANVLNMPAEWMVGDWTDLEVGLRHRPEPGEISWTAGVTSYMFRLGVPPSYRRHSTQPPTLLRSGAHHIHFYGIGQALIDGTDTLSTGFRSIGRAARGIQLLVRGSAIEQRLIEPHRARLSVWHQTTEDLFPQQNVVEIRFVASGTTEEELIYQATASDFEIPAGIGDVSTDERLKYGLSLHRIDRARQCTEITMHIQLNAIRSGEGQLVITAMPLETRDAGAASWQTAVMVRA